MLAPPPESGQTQDWQQSLPPDLTGPTTFGSPEVAAVAALLRPAQGPGELGRLGQYRVIEVLGAGGMGIVFRAEDLLLHRPVALKVMWPAIGQAPHHRERFLREARAAAAVTHPRIVTIYQVGEDQGVLFLAMEFLEGEPLAARLLRERPLALADTLRIGREVAEGLAAAHARGLIHRDVKPANIWLESSRQAVKLLDFGLARTLLDHAELTRPGIIVGTPAYMPPEQARGDPVDHRSDLYSLGTVLYCMCTGDLPFRGKNTLAVLTALALQPPAPVRTLRPETPQGLADLIERLLAKDPARRPASADEVVAALARLEQDCAGLFVPGVPALTSASDADTDYGTFLETFDVGASRVQALPAGDAGDAAPGTTAGEKAQDIEAPLLPPDRMHKLIGEFLGHYYLLGPVLGQGHHGIVFRAKDLNGNKVVALKVLAPDFPSTRKEKAQFTEAVRSGLSLRHPNLVALLAAGRNGPYCWLATEYVEGESLAQVINRLGAGEEPDWRFALRAAVHVCRALVLTSSRYLTHRNITPRNLLVRQADGAVLLNDLALARALRGTALARRVLDQKTRAELVYMAPEQADCESSYVDFLCDLYSLGAVAYHLMTGKPLFRAASFAEGLELVREGVPKAPRKIHRGIPLELDALVMRMLAKRQEDRFQHPAEVLNELERLARRYGVKC